MKKEYPYLGHDLVPVKDPVFVEVPQLNGKTLSEVLYDVDELRNKLTGAFCMKCNAPVPYAIAFCSAECQSQYVDSTVPLTPLGEALCDPEGYNL